jgi:hypothetical protein
MKKERAPEKEKYYYFIYDVITWEKIYKRSSTYYYPLMCARPHAYALNPKNKFRS